MNGEVSYLEIGSKDAEISQSFFAKVFAWPFRDDAWFQTPTVKAGLHGDDPTPQIYVFFRVTDIAAAALRVAAAGGKAEDITEQLGFGRFCNCSDPQGIVFGLHEPGVG